MSSSGSILRPMSPGLPCKALQPLGLLMEKDLDDIHQGLSQFRHEIVCAMSSKAIFQTDKGDIIPDIGICYYWCSFCRFNTDEKQKLEEHVLTHRFSCRYCSFQAFSRVDICRHGLKAHDDFRKVAHEYKWCTILSDFLQYDKRDSDTFPETVDAGKASPGADAGKASPGADADCSIVRIESAYPRGGGSARGRRRLCGRMFPNSSVVVLDGNSQSTNTQHVSSLAGKDSRKPSSTERTVGQYPKPVNNNQSTHDATITLTPKPVNDHRSTHDATITLTSKPVNENQPTHEVGVTHTPEPVNDGQSTHEAIVTDTEVTSDASQPPMEATPVDGSKPAAQPAVNSTLADSSQPVKDYTPARNSKPSQSSSVPKQCKAGLVWGCPRCDFLTTVWRFAQEHVKLVHRLNSGPLTKDDITNKIVTAAKMKQILQLDKDRAASGRGIQSTPGTEKDAANQDCTQKKAVKQEGEDKDVKPMSAHLLNGGAEEGDSSSQESADYLKCIHCQVRLSSPTLIREHQESEHKRLLFGAELVGAMNWKNFMYICPKRLCPFSSAEHQEFKEHMETCIEGLAEDPTNQVEIDQVMAFMRNVGEILRVKGTVNAVQESKPFSPDSFEKKESSSFNKKSRKRRHDLSTSSDEIGLEVTEKRVLRSRSQTRRLSQSCESERDCLLDESEDSEESFSDDEDEDFLPTSAKRKSTSPCSKKTPRGLARAGASRGRMIQVGVKRQRGRPWKMSQENPRELISPETVASVKPLLQNASMPNPPQTDHQMGGSAGIPRVAAEVMPSPTAIASVSRPGSASTSGPGSASASASSPDSAVASRSGSASGSARSSPLPPVGVFSSSDSVSTPQTQGSARSSPLPPVGVFSSSDSVSTPQTQGSARNSPLPPVGVFSSSNSVSTPQTQGSSPETTSSSPAEKSLSQKSSPEGGVATPRALPSPTSTPPARSSPGTTPTPAEVPAKATVSMGKFESARYKCSMCRITQDTAASIRRHIETNHKFQPLYALDLEAMVNNSARFLLFCHGPECEFSTYSREQYLEHVATCTPWLEESLPSNVTEDQKKSLSVTMTFAKTTMLQPQLLEKWMADRAGPHPESRGKTGSVEKIGGNHQGSLTAAAEDQEKEKYQSSSPARCVCPICKISCKSMVGVKIHMSKCHK